PARRGEVPGAVRRPARARRDRSRPGRGRPPRLRGGRADPGRGPRPLPRQGSGGALERRSSPPLPPPRLPPARGPHPGEKVRIPITQQGMARGRPSADSTGGKGDNFLLRRDMLMLTRSRARLGSEQGFTLIELLVVIIILGI